MQLYGNTSVSLTTAPEPHEAPARVQELDAGALKVAQMVSKTQRHTKMLPAQKGFANMQDYTAGSHS